jgi:membrane associated rhomboid family serine protease
MIPIKIDANPRHLPFVTIALILMCSIIFIQQHPSVEVFGLKPLYFVYTLFHPNEGLLSSFLTLIISFFLHGSFFHLIGNIWYLWLFGSALENLIGTKRFLISYLLFGVISMLVQIANDPLSTIPIVGASGAIAGIMGMYLILKPLSKIVLWFPPFFFFRLFSFLFLLFWFWLQWKNIGISEQKGNLIAWWAHIGGFIGGTIYACWLRLSKKTRLNHLFKTRKHH